MSTPNAPADASPLLLDRLEGGVVVLTLNRPQATNALSLELQALLSQRFTELADDDTVRCIVLTGGEPMLQIDAALIAALHARGFEIAVESNGTLPAADGIDWLCISPKAGTDVVQRRGDELKLVWPQPGSDVAGLAALDFTHRLVQPLDDPIAAENVQHCIDLVMADPRWRLSLQTHKGLGLR